MKQPPAAPRLYPVLPGQQEDPLDPVVAPPPYNRRMDPDSSCQDGGGPTSPPHTRGGAQYGGEERAVPLVPGETAAGRREIGDIHPSQPPNWDPNTTGGRDALLQYRQTLLRGLNAAARKPTNFGKISEVIQGREESPAAFLERLLEAGAGVLRSNRILPPLDSRVCRTG